MLFVLTLFPSTAFAGYLARSSSLGDALTRLKYRGNSVQQSCARRHKLPGSAVHLAGGDAMQTGNGGTGLLGTRIGEPCSETSRNQGIE